MGKLVGKGGTKAVAFQAMRHGLAGKMLAAGEDGDALVRLLLDGEERKGSGKRPSIVAKMSAFSIMSKGTKSPESDDEAEDAEDGREQVAFPSSLLRALSDVGEAFDSSLIDLLMAGRARDGRTPLLRLLFEGGLSKLVFRKPSKPTEPSLARLLLTPDRYKGMRSLMQILTDDEAMDDASRPSLMRSMLAGEESGERPSVLRLMLIRPKTASATSIMDELLHGEVEKDDSIARRLLSQKPDGSMAVARQFFADTPSGQPSLAKYMFGGESFTATAKRSSLLRLMTQGEARDQASLLRLLVTERRVDDKTHHALLDILTMGKPSLVDILLKGEESSSETSLARMMMGVTFTIQNGSVKMGNLLGDSTTSDHAAVPDLVTQTKPSFGAVSNANLATKYDSEFAAKEAVKQKLRRGVTIAKACMLGEEDGGPGISIMRAVLIGEESGMSILRLLVMGEEQGEVSPLRIILTGMEAAFVSASILQQAAGGTSSDNKSSTAANLLSPTNLMDTSTKIIKAISESVQDSHHAGSTWRETFDKLVDLGKTAVLDSSGAWQKNLAFVWTAFARVRAMGPDFAKVWKRQFYLVAGEIRTTGNRVHENSAWKKLAPGFAELCEALGDQEFQRVLANVARNVRQVEAVASGDQKSNNKAVAAVSKALDLIEEWAPRWV